MVEPTIIDDADNHPQSLLLDRPCTYCQVLELDDVMHGGSIIRRGDQTSYVSFGEISQSPEDMIADKGATVVAAMKALSFAQPNYNGELEKSRVIPRTEVNLPYKRNDVLPLLPGLATTASQGCAFCEVLRNDLISVWGETGHEEHHQSKGDTPLAKAKLAITEVSYKFQEFAFDPDRPKNEPNVGLDALYVFFTISSDTEINKYSLHYNFYTEASDLCASWFNLGRIPVVNDRVSVASLNRLHELIDLSLREKPIARTVDGFLPTRLLDLCLRGVADLRLVVTNEDPDLLAQDTSQKRYAALSYCWGPADKAINQLKTTRDVLDEHLSGIQLEKVPQTVSDAICVCRRLGIRYLWVDALCIIQGDEADWAKESFQMSEVYSNSFIALCIIQGDSCSSGFLRTNYSSHTVKIRFQSKLDSSISGYLHLRMLRSPRETLMKSSTHTGRPVGNSDDPASIDFSKALWGTRAWTFQEDEMSPRKLYFGDSMFYMSCGTLSEAADGSPFDHKRHLGEFISLNETLCSWYNLVSLYVARELSHEQDRLPAISALARSVCDHFPDQKYLAGLWGSDLHKGLLWTTTSWMEFEDYYKPQSHGYVAPSWSWACRPAKLHLIAGLTHHNVHFWPEFTLHGADISFNPLNPYGLVSEGRLSVSAKVFKLPVDKTGKARVNKSGRPKFLGIVFNYNLWSENDEYIAHLFLDWDYHSALHDNGGYPRGPIDQMSMVLITRTSLDQHFMFRSYDTTDQEVVLGILVRLVAGTEGDYERLGMWYSENKGLGGKKFWQNIPLQDLTLV